MIQSRLRPAILSAIVDVNLMSGEPSARLPLMVYPECGGNCDKNGAATEQGGVPGRTRVEQRYATARERISGQSNPVGGQPDHYVGNLPGADIRPSRVTSLA
jgi:hypothetical protein